VADPSVIPITTPVDRPSDFVVRSLGSSEPSDSLAVGALVGIDVRGEPPINDGEFVDNVPLSVVGTVEGCNVVVTLAVGFLVGTPAGLLVVDEIPVGFLVLDGIFVGCLVLDGILVGCLVFA